MLPEMFRLERHWGGLLFSAGDPCSGTLFACGIHGIGVFCLVASNVGFVWLFDLKFLISARFVVLAVFV